MFSSFFCLNFILLFASISIALGTPKSSPNWQELISTDGIKFTPRNGKIWVTGGKTDVYTAYNLLNSYQVADVWYSNSGGLWAFEPKNTGDYFAQNTDVVQPGPIPPWFTRYGHTLSPVDINGDGESDVMLLAGGYAPSPMNDQWITEDGQNWVYCNSAPWSPRAWHTATTFQGKLWLLGGTPLNNEVWRLDSVTKIDRVPLPLTRSMYNNYTYSLKWTQMPNASWSPRVGMGTVTQWYFNESNGEPMVNSSERIVVAGGYGGWLSGSKDPSQSYDGYYCRADTWATSDGHNWTLLNGNSSFGGRAWQGMVVNRGASQKQDWLDPKSPPKMFIFGGGYIGFQVGSNKKFTRMSGFADGYFSVDGVTWTKINYEEGGIGASTMPYYSSQEWAQTIVDRKTKWIGVWGHSLVTFNTTSGTESPGNIFFIAGTYTGLGEFSSRVFVNQQGIHCDINGKTCSGNGTCKARGCVCNATSSGPYCENYSPSNVKNSATSSRSGWGLLYSGWCVLLLAAAWALDDCDPSRRPAMEQQQQKKKDEVGKEGLIIDSENRLLTNGFLEIGGVLIPDTCYNNVSCRNEMMANRPLRGAISGFCSIGGVLISNGKEGCMTAGVDHLETRVVASIP